VTPPTSEQILETRLREIMGNQTITLVSLPSGLIIKGAVRSPEEAEALMRLLPPMNTPIMPFLALPGGGYYSRTVNNQEEQGITRRLQEVTNVNTVYVTRTANNALAVSGTVRTRAEYDAVRRYTQILPLLIGAGGATVTPAGSTTPAVAPGGMAAEPNEARTSKANLATSGYTMPTQVQMFVEITDPNERVIRTVTLETNLVEISRNNLRNLGVEVGSASVLSETRTAPTGGAVVVAPDGTRTVTAGTPGTVTRTIDPTFNSGSFLGGNGFIGLGPSGLINPIRVRLDALYRNGNARILSQPNVSSVEGTDAQITVGGERPVPSTSIGGGGAGTTTQSIEFRRFGVILTMRPTVSADNTILLQVRADVTAIDPSTAINLSGAIIPGETVRSVNTTLVVREGDMIAIGGLISNDHRVETSRVPILSRIPILGELFKSKRVERNETELAIFMQPRITRHLATTEELEAILRAPSLPELPGRQENKGPFEALGDNPTNK
jgi:Flp pilus assembly secretin CpaC